MSFSLTQMLLISAAYLAALFAVAWISERGMIPRAIIRHPLTYTLSLGVYASAWAFYGTVGGDQGLAHGRSFRVLGNSWQALWPLRTVVQTAVRLMLIINKVRIIRRHDSIPISPFP